MVGNHCVRHDSTTQSTISLSSGEAELHGISKGMQHAMGLSAMYKDLGLGLKLRVHSDATAAVGSSMRRGLDKSAISWVQEQSKTDRVLLEVLYTESPADMSTKYLDHVTMAKAIMKPNCGFQDGRAKAAPATMGLKKDTELPTCRNDTAETDRLRGR